MQVYRMLATYPLDYQIAFERYVGAGSAGGGSTPTPGQRLDGPFPPTPVDDSTH